MENLSELIERAAAQRKSIVLPEATDYRILEAANRLSADGVADVLLPGNPDEIRAAARDASVDISGLHLVDPSQHTDRYAESLYELRKHKGMTIEAAREQVADPLTLGTLMVQCDDADGCVAGARYTTAAVIRAALQIIGKKPDYAQVSSFFIMQFDKPFHTYRGIRLFADCALIIEPDAAQLADVAVATADTAKTMFAMQPRVAMLSFSTAGSAAHPLVDKVVDATRMAQQARPDYDYFGAFRLGHFINHIKMGIIGKAIFIDVGDIHSRLGG